MDTTPNTPAKTAKAPQSFGASLSDPKGNKLRFTAIVRKSGDVEMFATHIIVDSEGKPKSSDRGASSTHPTVDAARKALASAVEAAQKDGWTRKTGGGFVRQPDKFTLATLPKPKK